MRRREHERLMREKQKEIDWLRSRVDELLDRVMYLSDRPWGLPPQEPEEPMLVMPQVYLDPGPELEEELANG